MPSLTENEKLFWSLKWLGIVLLAIIAAMGAPQIGYLIDTFLALCASTVWGRESGKVNLIIAYVIMSMIPIVPFILLRLKPVSLIAVIIALLPLFGRIRRFPGIYAYTTFYAEPELISGIALFAPLLFGYLLFRYPTSRGWWLPSSKAFWLLAASGVMTQFVFFSPFFAIRIAYLVIVVQLLWYLTIVAHVNTMEDVYKLMWGILTAVVISSFLTIFTIGQDIDFFHDLKRFGRLQSNSLGSCNEYGAVLSSTLCLLPILFTRAQRLGKIVIIIIIPLFLTLILLTGTRGAYFSLLPILGYAFILRHRKKQLVFYVIVFIITFWMLWDRTLVYLEHRPIYFDARLYQVKSFQERILMWKSSLQALMTWPYFLTGFGVGTLGNWYIPGGTRFGHDVHHGFLWVWVNSGLAGFLGFCFWLSYALWAGIKKAMRSYDFEEKLVLLGLVLSITCWIILFMITKGTYTGGWQEPYALLTTEVALLVALSQKPRFNRSRDPEQSWY